MSTLVTIAGAILALAEAMFYIFYRLYLLPHMNAPSRAPPYPGKCSRSDFILRILRRIENEGSAEDNERMKIKKFLRGWFFDIEFEAILQGNIVEFLAWAMFSKHTGCLESDERLQIEKVLEYVATVHSIKFTEGYNETAKCARLNLEPVSPLHRPLLFYVAISFLALISSVVLNSLGFRKRKTRNQLVYWVRSGTNPALSPLIFFHGIAPACHFPYIPLLHYLLSNNERSALLVENNCVSMTMNMDPLTEFGVVDGIQLATARHFPTNKKFVLMGHSVGTCPITWCLRAFPESVEKIFLLDPVTLLLSNHDVAVNFLYRKSYKTISEIVIDLFASKEMFTRTFLGRHFFWFRNELWLEDVPGHVETTILIAGKDEIVNGESVRRLVESLKLKSKNDEKQIDLIYRESLTHAGMLLDRSIYSELRSNLSSCLKG